MTEKRYFAKKHLLRNDEIHDIVCHKFLNTDETVEHMNNQYWKYKLLKQRNDRQAETIRELYNLIENKDWETLTVHIRELNKAEEQLQSEWGCYE